MRARSRSISRPERCGSSSDETGRGAGGEPQPLGPGQGAADGSALEGGEPLGPGQVAADGSAQEGGDAADGRPEPTQLRGRVHGARRDRRGDGARRRVRAPLERKASSQQRLLEPALHGPCALPWARPAQYNDLGHAKADLANAAVWSFLAAGAAGLGTAAYVLLTGQPEARDATATGLSVSPMPGGLVISKRW